MTSMSINALVTQTFHKLVKKVAQSWIYENFGQRELRIFEDKFSAQYGKHPNYVNHNLISKQSQQYRDLFAIKKFSKWILTYNGK